MFAGDPAILGWTFKSAQFGRVVNGDQWERWFQTNAIASVEPLLDTKKQYVDIGGWTYGDLSILAAFETASERDAAVNMVGQTGTLGNGNGYSRTALMKGAQAQGGTAFFYATLVFAAV